MSNKELAIMATIAIPTIAILTLSITILVIPYTPPNLHSDLREIIGSLVGLTVTILYLFFSQWKEKHS
jgi:hypothetical protein